MDSLIKGAINQLVSIKGVHGLVMLSMNPIYPRRAAEVTQWVPAGPGLWNVHSVEPSSV